MAIAANVYHQKASARQDAAEPIDPDCATTLQKTMNEIRVGRTAAYPLSNTCDELHGRQRTCCRAQDDPQGRFRVRLLVGNGRTVDFPQCPHERFALTPVTIIHRAKSKLLDLFEREPRIISPRRSSDRAQRERVSGNRRRRRAAAGDRVSMTWCETK